MAPPVGHINGRGNPGSENSGILGGSIIPDQNRKQAISFKKGAQVAGQKPTTVSKVRSDVEKMEALLDIAFPVARKHP